MYLFMEIKPNLVNNNMRLNSYETNTQGNNTLFRGGNFCIIYLMRMMSCEISVTYQSFAIRDLRIQ